MDSEPTTDVIDALRALLRGNEGVAIDPAVRDRDIAATMRRLEDDGVFDALGGAHHAAADDTSHGHATGHEPEATVDHTPPHGWHDDADINMHDGVDHHLDDGHHDDGLGDHHGLHGHDH